MPRPKVDYYFDGLEKPLTIDWNTATPKDIEMMDRLTAQFGQPTAQEPHLDVANRILPGVTAALMGGDEYDTAVEESGGPPEYDQAFASPEAQRFGSSMSAQLIGEEAGAATAGGLMKGLLSALPQGKMLRAVKPAAQTISALVGAGIGGAEGQREAQSFQEHTLGIAPDTQSPLNAGLWGAAGTGGGMLLGTTAQSLGKKLVRAGIEPEVAARRMIRLDNIGVDPTILQVVDPGFYRSAIEMLHRLPTSQGAVAMSVKRTNNQLSTAIDKATRVNIDGELKFPEYRYAGSKIKGNASTFNEVFKETNRQNYNNFYKMLPKDFSIRHDNLRSFLDNAVKGNKRPILRVFSNKKTQKVFDDLVDNYITSKKLPNGQIAHVIRDIPFEDIKQLRTMVGDLLSNKSMRKKYSKKDLTGMYKALSEDIRAALPEGTGPRSAFDHATEEFMTGAERIQTTLDRVHKKVTPEESFYAMEQMVRKNNVTHLENIKESFKHDPEGWEIVRRTWLHDSVRLGGGQDLTPMSFFDSWRNMTPETKRMISDTPGASAAHNNQVYKNLDDLSRIARSHWSPQGQANPLMTRSEIRNIVGKSGEASKGIGGTLLGGAVAAGGAAAGLGIWPLVALGVALKGPAFISKVMFDPKFTRWAIEGANVSPNGIGAHLGRLGSIYGASDVSAEEKQHIKSFLEVIQMVNEEAALESGDPIQVLMSQGGGF